MIMARKTQENSNHNALNTQDKTKLVRSLVIPCPLRQAVNQLLMPIDFAQLSANASWWWQTQMQALRK
jgi:hypothetical protein